MVENLLVARYHTASIDFERNKPLTVLEMIHLSTLVNLQQLDFELQGGVGGNDRRVSPRSITLQLVDVTVNSTKRTIFRYNNVRSQA